MEWEFTEDWDKRILTNGDYVGFVYLFQFEDGSTYIGSKQMYKRVKEVKKLKGDSVSNNWENYTSSSKIVNQKIEDGEQYRKVILYAFPTMRETLLVESILILHEMLKPNCLNLAMVTKIRVPNAKDKKSLLGIVQELLEMLR
ncbi:hypothetical protein I7V27_21965 [Lelliottia amnigena]|uniref:Putative endonuclease SegE-like GIY-YIG domain-containing protein n=2 Tax=Lelliottia amnigena TaxID=61646 RepID=A0AAP2AH89_LELAM|nr:hypothetical protein [Lelliottia amnigena]MBL5937088.1 hypothetical protein [Lelliottia amnigena]